MKQAGERSNLSKANVRTRVKQASALAVGAAALLTGCHFGGENGAAPQESRTPGATASASARTEHTPKATASKETGTMKSAVIAERRKAQVSQACGKLFKPLVEMPGANGKVDIAHPNPKENAANFTDLNEFQNCVQAEWDALQAIQEADGKPTEYAGYNADGRQALMEIPVAYHGKTATLRTYVGVDNSTTAGAPDFSGIRGIETTLFPGGLGQNPAIDLWVSPNGTNNIRNTNVIRTDDSQVKVENSQLFDGTPDGKLQLDPLSLTDAGVATTMDISRDTATTAASFIGTLPDAQIPGWHLPTANPSLTQ